MLRRLYVKNLALISEQSVEFGEGLNILTGETGAGKSILLGSIGLALGERADHDRIRDGEESALVELVFDAAGHEALMDKLGIAGDEEIILRRRIAGNRSSVTVNGVSVTLRELKELTEGMLDVYGQNESQRLLEERNQMELLDSWAGPEAARLRQALAASWKELVALRRELSESDTDENARLREADLLRFEIAELEGLKVREGESEELHARRRKLSSAVRLKEAAREALAYTDGDEAALELVGRAFKALNEVSSADAEVQTLSDALAAAEDILRDAVRAIADYAESVESDPEELTELERRIDEIASMSMKYTRGHEEAEAFAKALTERVARLEHLENYDRERQEMISREAALHAECLALAERLSGLRSEAAGRLTQILEEELRELNFLQSRFEICVDADAAQLGPTGMDKISFRISMNPGEPIRPLSQVASGGELSRIMLAIKSVLADKGCDCLVFDEIDAGISGQTARKVATRLTRLAKTHQILCITHLPQIAAAADCHFVIEKMVEEGRTYTKIRPLDAKSSLDELTRLLGGDVSGGAARENATALRAAIHPTSRS